MNPTKNKDSVLTYCLVGVGNDGEYCVMDTRTSKYLGTRTTNSAVRFKNVASAAAQMRHMAPQADRHLWADTVAQPQVEHKIVLELTLDELDVLRALVSWSRPKENKLATKLVNAYPTRQLWLDAPTFGGVRPYVAFFPVELLPKRK